MPSPSLGSGTQHVPVSKTSINTLNKVSDHTPNTQSASSIEHFHCQCTQVPKAGWAGGARQGYTQNGMLTVFQILPKCFSPKSHLTLYIQKAEMLTMPQLPKMFPQPPKMGAC